MTLLQVELKTQLQPLASIRRRAARQLESTPPLQLVTPTQFVVSPDSRPRLVQSRYEKELNRLLATDDTQLALTTVINLWLMPRTSMGQNNAKVEKTGRILVDEIIEAKAEAELRGLRQYSKESEDLEWGDVLIIAAGIINGVGLHLDQDRVRGLARNKMGHDTVIDSMIEVAGNLESHTVKPELEYLLSLWFRALADVPGSFDLQATIRADLRKDFGNYPAWAFSPVDLRTGRRFNPDELENQYAHAKACVKFIRYAKMALGNDRIKNEGMPMGTCEPYKHWIIDFFHPEWALANLKQQFALEHKVKLPLLELAIQDINRGELSRLLTGVLAA